MHPSDAASLAAIKLGSRLDPQAASTVEARFNPNHAKDSGKFTGKGGGAGAGAGSEVQTAVVGAVQADLMAGRSTTCAPAQVDGLMTKLAGQPPPPPNLAHLQVKGAGNENLYQKHVREIPRSEMPQLPNNTAGLKAFTDGLAARGVKARLTDMDPRQLRATQNQLNAQKVGKLYTLMRDNGWQKGGVMIASRDGDILDGHHRWAGAAAVAASGKPLKIQVLQVDMGIDDLLTYSAAFSGPKAGMEAGLAPS